MTERPPSTTAAAGERVRISCPGCGRNDWVVWPAREPVLRWKCFNCGRESDLRRKEGRH